MIAIDCSIGEGGAIRAAVALALAFGVPVRLTNIRTRSREGGLGWQHVLLIEGIAGATGSTASGLFLGSQELHFFPGSVREPHVEVDFDDYARTFVATELAAVRNHENPSDHFSRPLWQQNLYCKHS